MARTRKPITEKTERRWQDAVTGEQCVLVLDDVQKALERVHQTIDGQMLKLNAADQEQLVDRIRTLLNGMVRRT